MRITSTILLSFVWGAATFVLPIGATAQDATTEQAAETATEAQFTAEELQKLAAPVALYPDTLLIQILVAATYPLEVSKADQFVQDHADQEPEARKALIEEQGWDDSVTVLATAFPETLEKMATHIEWTETIGAAMLVQSDDLLDAVQVKRAEAKASGNLESGEEQNVVVTQEDNGDQTIIIEPADPQVVYVPQYNTETVYVTEETTESSSSAGDVVAAGLLFFGTAIAIDAIFDDDDDWYGYWGCRNCCGWNGRPIHHDPNRVVIDNDRNVVVNTGDVNIGWQPDPGSQAQARQTIQDRRAPGGASTLPARSPNRGDELRRDLTARTGAADITRPENSGTLDQIRAPEGPERGSAPNRDNASPVEGRKPQVQARPDRPQTRPARGADGPRRK